ncbi:MAG: nucleoside triphosphate pyrophosphohydrolase [Ruminococcus sp.]|nr:nucleoside triphosphate pyrophosphohydrolase [Ruminococcus sp.]
MFEFKERYNINDLIEIVSILRSENGCPWDKVQTHESIRKDFIEEVYEVIEAIDLKDSDLLKEELGDVLLNTVFHTQIESEDGNFNFDDVCNDICQKMIVRHPHVFGDVSANTTDQVLNNWDKIKMNTKGQTTYTETLESVAKSLPALIRAEKVGKRASKANMDFQDVQTALQSVKDETSELQTAIENDSTQQVYEEFGDLLFSCVNLGRKLGIDSERALVDATNKFIDRFSKAEDLIRSNGIDDMKSLDIHQLDAYWQKAKILK